MIVEWLQECGEDNPQFRQETVRDEIAAKAYIADLAVYGVTAWIRNG